jgi:hypothetical protein
MDAPSLVDRFFDQNSDALVYSAFVWRRYLLALYVCALWFLLRVSGLLGLKAVQVTGADIFI